VFGWLMVCALVLAMPDVRQGAAQGAAVVPWILRSSLPATLAVGLLAGIVTVQYLCGLAALTSASRMTFAFARDGGLPASNWLRRVSPVSQSPSVAVWATAGTGVAFTLLVPYTTIAAVCTVLLYISYVIPIAAGLLAYGRSWTRFGPWQLGAAYRPLAAMSVAGCLLLLVIGVQPPNELALRIVGGVMGLLVIVWFGLERRRFRGPPMIRQSPESSAEP